MMKSIKNDAALDYTAFVLRQLASNKITIFVWITKIEAKLKLIEQLKHVSTINHFDKRRTRYKLHKIKHRNK